MYEIQNRKMKTYQILIIAGIFIVLIFLINPVPYCKTATYSSEKYFFNVVGNSMFPIIKNNSYCVCYQKDKYEVKDIVVYFPKINNEYVGVAHRIIEIDDGEIYLKGDNNNFIEGPIHQDNIYCSIPITERFRTIL